MFRNRHSLVWRIAIPFAVLLTLSMGALSLYLSNTFRTSYIEISEANIQADTRLAADRFAALIEENAPGSAINERAKRYADLLGVRVTIIDTKGTVLGESHSLAQEMENHLNRPEIQRALQGETSRETRYSDTLQNEMMYVAAPMYDSQGKLVGVTRLAISLHKIQENINLIQASVLTGTAITLALALGLSFLIAVYTIQPVQQLTSLVQDVANGNLDKINPPTRQDEIGSLQLAFQFMANQLKDQIIALQKERRKLEAILSHMTDGIIIVDHDGRVQLINPFAQELFQNSEAESGERSLIEIVRNHQLVELWRKSRQSGAQETVTLETSPARLFIQGIAIPLEPALPGMTLLLVQDLTRVRRLETVRRDFVSNVSHELRTPLASLKALAETLQESALEDPPAARRFLQRMETEIDNLSQMVHELLELSRIDSNKVPLNLRVLPLQQVIQPPIERMQMQAERAGLMLQLEPLETDLLVRADPDRLGQVLINLIHNAIKFTSPGGKITISGRLEGNRALIAVQDSGVGIPSDALTRIFERFYKADRSRSGGGTGLGLSIARHLVEAHGGRIWAESEVGAGSTFFITIPLA